MLKKLHENAGTLNSDSFLPRHKERVGALTQAAEYIKLTLLMLIFRIQWREIQWEGSLLTKLFNGVMM
jgi:hypothetical protein